MTGPPIGETHEEMAEPVAPDPETKRAPGRKAASAPVRSPTSRPEAAIAQDAFAAKDPGLLPPDGRSIFDRMKQSYLRYVAHRIAAGGGESSRSGRPLRTTPTRSAGEASRRPTTCPGREARPFPALRLVKSAPRGVIGDV